ncbi:hypothetical protein [Thermaurantiacus sp.]
MPTLARHFAFQPMPAEPFSAPLTRALRLWILLARAGRNPRPAVRELIGPAEPAFALFLDLALAAWPGPIATFPPCATRLSPDETTLLGLLTAASRGDRREAERLTCEFLPDSERERLFAAAIRVVEGLGA